MRQQSFIITNIFDWCLKAFVFFSPIIWLPNFTQSNLQLLFFNYGAVVLFGLSIVLPSKREFGNYLVPTLLIFGAFLSFVKNPHFLSLSFLNIIFGCMLYYAIVRCATDIKGVLKCFAIAVFVNIGALILQISGMDLLYSPQSQGWPLKCGFMAKSNHLAVFLAIITPILAYKSILFVFLIGAILFILKCYTAIIVFVIGLLFLYRAKLKNWKVVVPVVVLLIGICIVFIPPLFNEYSYKITSRIQTWEFMLKESFVNPFIGHGLDSFKIHVQTFGLDKALIINSYNEFLRVAYEFGPAFLIIFFILMFRYYKNIFLEATDKVLPNILCASVISFLAVFAFQDPLHIPRIAVPMLVMLALFEASCLKKEEKYA